MLWRGRAAHRRMDDDVELGEYEDEGDQEVIGVGIGSSYFPCFLTPRFPYFD